MISTLRNAWKTPELRKRILYTLLLITVFRFGHHIPVTGVDTSLLQKATQNGGGLVNFYDLISGGAFSTFSIFALGVTPYINASIIMQLLTVAIPYLEQLSKEGEDGRKKIQKYTRYAAIPLALIQAYGSYALIVNYGAIKDAGKLNLLLILITLTTASVFLMWLGDQITVRGLGNGVSLIIFINIISRLPMTVYQLGTLEKTEAVSKIDLIVFIVLAIGMLVSVILMNLAERRISVQYAGKTVGNKSFKGQSTHIPINLTASGVIAIIFAMSVMQFPSTIGQFLPQSWFNLVIVNGQYSPFKNNTWQYAVVYALLVIFFSWFYILITFKPDEMAENMHKSAGFIPGIRPGKPTATFIERVLTRVSLIGGSYAALIAIIPIIIQGYTGFQGISFGGTALLIMVGVALDTMRQLESQLVMRHYQGFLK